MEENKTIVERTPLETWYAFAEIIKGCDAYRKVEGAELFAYQIYHLKATVTEYIRFCFESVSHQRLDRDNRKFYTEAALNKAFTKIFADTDNDLVKKIMETVENGSSAFTEHDLFQIALYIYKGVEESMNMPGLCTISSVSFTQHRYFKIYETDKGYSFLKMWDRFIIAINKVFLGCDISFLEDNLARFYELNCDDNAAVRAKRDFVIDARIMINDLIAEAIFGDDKNAKVADMIMNVDSGDLDVGDITGRQLNEVTDILYNELEDMVGASRGTLRTIV